MKEIHNERDILIIPMAEQDCWRILYLSSPRGTPQYIVGSIDEALEHLQHNTLPHMKPGWAQRRSRVLSKYLPLHPLAVHLWLGEVCYPHSVKCISASLSYKGLCEGTWFGTKYKRLFNRILQSVKCEDFGKTRDLHHCPEVDSPEFKVWQEKSKADLSKPAECTWEYPWQL